MSYPTYNSSFRGWLLQTTYPNQRQSTKVYKWSVDK